MTILNSIKFKSKEIHSACYMAITHPMNFHYFHYIF